MGSVYHTNATETQNDRKNQVFGRTNDAPFKQNISTGTFRMARRLDRTTVAQKPMGTPSLPDVKDGSNGEIRPLDEADRRIGEQKPVPQGVHPREPAPALRDHLLKPSTWRQRVKRHYELRYYNITDRERDQ